MSFLEALAFWLAKAVVDAGFTIAAFIVVLVILALMFRAPRRP